MKKLTKAEHKLMLELMDRAALNGQEIPCISTSTEVSAADKNAVMETLAERGARYGDFSDHARLAQRLQVSLHKFTVTHDNGADMPISHIVPWDLLPAIHRQALTVICDKIARILSGDPNYADNWHDIQGYAKLVEDRLQD